MGVQPFADTSPTALRYDYLAVDSFTLGINERSPSIHRDSVGMIQSCPPQRFIGTATGSSCPRIGRTTGLEAIPLWYLQTRRLASPEPKRGRFIVQPAIGRYYTPIETRRRVARITSPPAVIFSGTPDKIHNTG